MAKPPIRKTQRIDWDNIKPQTPINFGVASNGEFFHPQTPKKKMIEDMVIERATANAERVGMDRRKFLASFAGMATTMAVVHTVSGCKGSDGGASSVECDEDGARELYDPNAKVPFIMDVQTHHIDNTNKYDDPEYGNWRGTNQLYGTFFGVAFSGSKDPVTGLCKGESSALNCLGMEDYVDLLFAKSDCTVTVLSTFPAIPCTTAERIGYTLDLGFCGDFLPTAAMADTRDTVNQAAGSSRCVSHAAVMPNPPSWLSASEKQYYLDQQLEAMAVATNTYGIKAWKCYTPFGALPLDKVQGKTFDELLPLVLSSQVLGEGWYLDDESGQAMIEKGLELGANIFNVHKGIPLPTFDHVHTSARDIGVVATRYPDAVFVVYHSALNNGTTGMMGEVIEGPYNASEFGPGDDPMGINSLIHSLVVNGITAENNRNVYAEMGGPGARCIQDPVQGTHIMGKLLRHVGEDYIVWGTDAIWGGTPQGLIEGFINFQMVKSIQDEFGYPDLTMDIKKKILGLNAARLYGLDPEEKRCEVANDKFAQLRRDVRLARQMRNPLPIRPNEVMNGPRTRREFASLWVKNRFFPF